MYKFIDDKEIKTFSIRHEEFWDPNTLLDMADLQPYNYTYADDNESRKSEMEDLFKWEYLEAANADK